MKILQSPKATSNCTAQFVKPIKGVFTDIRHWPEVKFVFYCKLMFLMKYFH